MRLSIEGLTDEEAGRLRELVNTPGRRENVLLQLAAAMQAEGCKDGALWVCKKLIVHRARRGKPE